MLSSYLYSSDSHQAISSKALSFLGMDTDEERWIASHFHDREAFPEWADRTWSGQDRWMSRTVCRRPARWAPFFSTWPGYWPTLVSPDSLSFSPTGFSSQSPSPRSTCPLDGPCPPPERLSLPPVRPGFRQTRHCLHHKRPPPSNRPPPPILVEGAAYDLAMRLQQHMPWHDH